MFRVAHSVWLKYMEELRQVHGNVTPAHKRIRTAKQSDIEAALLMWFEDARAQKFQFLVQFSKKKQRLGIDDFQFSDGWLHGFKSRYNIQFRMITGESGDVTTEQIDQWTTITLP